MPSLQKEVLEAKLSDFRYGNTIRCHLSYPAHQRILSLKAQTGRSYHDIIRIVLESYSRYRFPIEASKGKIVLNFRYGRDMASTVKSWAWGNEVNRSRFIGGVVEGFLSRVPKSELRKILKKRLDQTVRLIKETVCG